MTTIASASSVIDPIRALQQTPGTLAVITNTQGPSYRPKGAMMAILADGTCVGNLSSGCIEADLALHAKDLIGPKTLRYGDGSPFQDIELPCGGQLDILLIPSPDSSILSMACQHFDARIPFDIGFEFGSGHVHLNPDQTFQGFRTRIEPEVFFYIFGKGPEVETFSNLIDACGYPQVLITPDAGVCDTACAMGRTAHHLTSPTLPMGVAPDARSAAVLFFHDHSWEPQILQKIVKSDAFYIGCQGSVRAAQTRQNELLVLGLSGPEIDRIKGPIGLVPSAKDPRKLAVGVLAEILACAG